MANTPDKPQMTDDERADLMAMIAAGRELSPEMDRSLVESYAERRAAEATAKAKVQGNAVVPQQQPNGAVSNTHPAVAMFGMAMFAAIFVAILVLSQGHAWWIIFPMFALFGGWWGNNDRHRLRNQYRAERYQMRADYYRARMGMPPRDDARSLPQSSASDSGPLPPPASAPAQTPRSVSAPPAQSSGESQPPFNPAG
jgi:hypothetical protein